MISYTSPLTIKVAIPLPNTNDGVFYTLIKSDLVLNFNFNFNIDPSKVIQIDFNTYFEVEVGVEQKI